MSQPQLNTWQAIQAEVLRRIHAREWPPGSTIPGEVELAQEFGCARATVNRALQAVADTGLLERRRKAGTRVALRPVSRATVEIPLIRDEIEDHGMAYTYRRISSRFETPDPTTAIKLGVTGQALHVIGLHLGDDTPFVLEDRWINIATAPEAGAQPYDRMSANEWLLMHTPYTRGDIAFSAQNASDQTAEILKILSGRAIFIVERTTWDGDAAVTSVRLSYAPGYRIQTMIGGGM
jgi:GntR family histidine utilization transcriptional repressor